MWPGSRKGSVKRVSVIGIDGRIRKAITLEESVQYAIGTAIYVLGNEHVGVGLEKLERRRNGRHTARERKAAKPVL